MLSSQEQQVWDDVQRYWPMEAEEPPRLAPPAPRWTRTSPDPEDLPLAVVAGIWITIALILFGAMAGALTVGVATTLGWALWHYWPRWRGRGAPRSEPRSSYDETSLRSADEHWTAD